MRRQNAEAIGQEQGLVGRDWQSWQDRTARLM